MNSIILLSILIIAVCPVYSKQCNKCVTIEKCSILKKYFMHTRPYSGQSSKFYTTIACGFEGFTPKVCCDEKVITYYFKDDEKLKYIKFNNDTNIKDNNDDKEAVSNEKPEPKEVEINKYCYNGKESKIVGGVTAAVGLFPWMAKLGYTTGGSQMMLMKSDSEEDILFRCGGSLITMRHVLTAAHCISKLPDKMELNQIMLDADRNPIKRYPEKLFPHPQYDIPFVYDIGIIKMNRQVKITDYVRPICLPFGSMAVNPAELLPRMLMVAGWGALKSGSSMISPRLRYTRLTYFADEKCRRLFRTKFNVTLNSGHLCTIPDMERDACAGDSGGPLFAWAGDGSSPQAVALALVSFGGRQCANRDIPGVYTRIDFYNDWIMKTVLL